MTLVHRMTILVVLLCLHSAVIAEQLWQGASISYLWGERYRVPLSADPGKQQESRQIITFEHAAGYSWGDSFIFYDRLFSRDGSRESEHYAELQARYALSGLTQNIYMQVGGLVENWLLAAQVEIQDDSNGGEQKNGLLGIGAKLKVPGFAFVDLNVFRRFNDKQPYADSNGNRTNREHNWQLTAAWAYPFALGSQQLVWDGFFDYTSANSDFASMFHSAMQFKWDVGRILGALPKKLYVGAEYEFWQNKFGIKDTGVFPTNERNLQLLIQYHF